MSKTKADEGEEAWQATSNWLLDPKAREMLLEKSI